MLSEESVVRVRDFFMRSLKKSIRRANRELAMPMMTVWKVLHKDLELHFYRLQLLQVLKPTNLVYSPNNYHKENILNNQPLTYASEEMDDLTPLSPSMFLREESGTDLNDLD
ncbi:hypothetical protein TNCV_2050481 [Trichonephila clavipes]|nr:hypothetical protein TNCV_2050481 [Trichonephila clavipes]